MQSSQFFMKTVNTIYIAMELCGGGELYDKIEEGEYDEVRAQ